MGCSKIRFQIFNNLSTSKKKNTLKMLAPLAARDFVAN
jgi:hypothetical protein